MQRQNPLGCGAHPTNTAEPCVCASAHTGARSATKGGGTRGAPPTVRGGEGRSPAQGACVSTRWCASAHKGARQRDPVLLRACLAFALQKSLLLLYLIKVTECHHYGSLYQVGKSCEASRSGAVLHHINGGEGLALCAKVFVSCIHRGRVGSPKQADPDGGACKA